VEERLLSSKGVEIMNSRKLWVEITVAGFPFLATAYFIFLFIFGIYDLEHVKPALENLPYTAVLVTVLSYVFGLAAHVVSQRAYEIVTPDKYDAEKDIEFGAWSSDYTQRHASYMYSTLVLFRLLTFGTFFLGITLTLWIRCTEWKEQCCAVALTCLLLMLLFGIAWRSHRPPYKKFRDAANKSVEKARATNELSQKAAAAKKR
jgi:hypothetical protein